MHSSQSDPASMAESTDTDSSFTSLNGQESHEGQLIPQPSPSTAESLHDIGMLAKPSASIDEICLKMCSLSNGEKFGLLFNHVELPTSFPATYTHGCHRKFSANWVEKYPWLRYSPCLDGVFCGPCSVCLPTDSRRDKGLLVNRPFSNWVKTSDTLLKHSKHSYHRESLQAAENLKMVIENPSSRVDMMLSSTLRAQMEENKHILKQIIRAIIFLAKQGLALRGHREEISSNGNPGNFLALLKSYAEADDVLHAHLYKPRARNATYLSPTSQNQIINLIGLDII